MPERLLSLLTLIVLFAAVACWRFERRRLTAQDIALVASLAALAALFRIPFAVIPNAQPTTFLVVVSGLVFGPSFGLTVGVTAAFASNIFLGHGPWTPFQMLAWGLCGASAGVLMRLSPSAPKYVWVGFSFVWGFLFGSIMNLYYWYAFVHPLTIETYLGVLARAFWFDATHAVCNAILYATLGEEFRQVLSRFRDKLSFVYYPQTQKL